MLGIPVVGGLSWPHVPRMASPFHAPTTVVLVVCPDRDEDGYYVLMGTWTMHQHAYTVALCHLVENETCCRPCDRSYAVHYSVA